MTLENTLYDWLPNCICMDKYKNWDEYIDALYALFVCDFIKSQNFFNGKKVMCKKHPEVQGKSATFWHIISEGLYESTEQERIPHEERCKRLPWIRPIISTSHTLKIWKNSRSTKKGLRERICIALENFEYLVILEERESYVLLWTAYPIEKEYRRKKLKKEYERSVGETL